MKRWVRRAAFMVAVTSVSTSTTAHAAATMDCWHADEIDAVRFQEFKLMLNVGALNCERKHPRVLQSYNDFVVSKRDFIVTNAAVVRAHYIRNSGVVGGMRNFTDFETTAGNRHSYERYDATKCETVGTFSRLAARTADEDMPQLVRLVAAGPQPEACPVDQPATAYYEPVRRFAPRRAAPPVPMDPPPLPSGYAVTSEYESDPAPEPAAFASAAPEAPPAPEPVVAAAAAPEPKPEPATPTEAAPTPPALPAAPSSSAASALAEAARALAAAAAAMQQPNN